jgi:hypothetical protein
MAEESATATIEAWPAKNRARAKTAASWHAGANLQLDFGRAARLGVETRDPRLIGSGKVASDSTIAG